MSNQDLEAAVLAELTRLADGPETQSHSGETVLPSAPALARRMGVSTYAVRLALRNLRSRGEVRFERGSRLRIPRPYPETPSGSRAAGDGNDSTAERRLADEMAHRLALGEWRHGNALPKAISLVLEKRLSPNTVAKAFGLLEGKGLIHRKGKRWSAGAAPEAAPRALLRDPPVFLVLQDRVSQWRSLAESQRTKGFFSEFRTLSEHGGYRLVPVASDAREVVGVRRLAPVECASILRSLGRRYRGSLMLFSNPPDQAYGWLRPMLEAQGQPAVWFDRLDAAGPGKPSETWFTRCHHSEEAAAQLAVKCLLDAGHKEAVYLACMSGECWQTQRGRCIRRAAEGTELRVHLVEGPEPDLEYLPQSLESPSESPGPVKEQESQEMRRLRQHMPFLRQVLNYPGATALIAPRDFNASYLHALSIRSGLRIPEKMSMLSFDNYDAYFGSQVSTIDFGFGFLGFTAYHLLARDFPVPKTRNQLPARPHLVDRGSLAPPRKGSLGFRAFSSRPRGL